MVVQASNPSTPEAEAGGPRIQGQPELHSKILSKKKKNVRNKSHNTSHKTV
jgi:hypothetical protein